MIDTEMLEAMRTMIAPLTDSIEKLGGKVDQLGGRMDRLEEKVDRLEGRIDRLEGRMDHMESELSGVKVIIDTDIRKELNLLAENQELILERLPDPADAEALEERVSALEAVVRTHSMELQELKKAQ